MQRVVIIASLTEGSEDRAAELLAGGPPFDPAGTGFERHGVYLSEREVVFVFEGPDAEWQVDDLISDPFRPGVTLAIEAWRPLLAGNPRLAQEAYFWQRTEPPEDADVTGPA